ncbi:hypothetical protein BC835DRAFT_1307958 [Cytidiella melzeri]|nr:hypothetical protein BC835DRAFT_1307958 [Cytidiella melzeri]
MPYPEPQPSLPPTQDNTSLASTMDYSEAPLDLSLDSLVLTEPPKEWIKQAQATCFRRIVIVETSPASGTLFDGLAPFLARNSEVCQQVCEIELAGAANSHIQLFTDILYDILRNHRFPNLQSLILRNVTVIHVAPDEIGAPPFHLCKLTLVNTGDILASALLWIIRRFWGIDHLTLNGVNVLHDAESPFPHEHVCTAWTFADVARLPLPQLVRVRNLEIKNSCTSRFYMNFLRTTPSIQTLESISISCSHPDDFIALGGLISEACGTLKTISINISDCTRFGMNALENTEVTEHYFNALKSCTSLENFAIEFYLAPHYFQLNDAAWRMAVRSFGYLPRSNIVRNLNLNFNAGCAAGLPFEAFTSLDWKYMSDVFCKRIEYGRREMLTLTTDNGFDHAQMDFMATELADLAFSGRLWFNQRGNSPEDGLCNGWDIWFGNWDHSTDVEMSHEGAQ